MRSNLGSLFHLALEDMPIDEFAQLFCSSDVARMIENAEPDYLAGKSGSELYSGMMSIDPGNRDIVKDKEYWLGHTLAYIQWYWNVSFEKLDDVFPMKEMLGCYDTLHEADISKINLIAGKRLHPVPFIKERRKIMGMTQKELSDVTGISLATIRAYEQGNLSVLKAESGNVFRLSRALGCSMEDIVRNNVMISRL